MKHVRTPSFKLEVILNLSGNSPVDEERSRKRPLVAVDRGTIDATMKTLAPRVAFTVPNTLSGDGELVIDLVFRSMADFSPDEIAKKVPQLAKLFDARAKLEGLLSSIVSAGDAATLLSQVLSEGKDTKGLAERGEKRNALGVHKRRSKE